MKILFAIDGSPCADYALKEACRLLSVQAAVARVIAVIDPQPYSPGLEGLATGAPQVLESEVKSLRDALEQARAYMAEQGLVVEVIETQGKPADKILEEAADFRPDVIVMGTHGRNAIGRLMLGSVSDRVLRHWHGPVMVIRPLA